VAAAQGEYSAAEAHFEKAISTFHLQREEADTLQYWAARCFQPRTGTRYRKVRCRNEIYRSRGESIHLANDAA